MLGILYCFHAINGKNECEKGLTLSIGKGMPHNVGDECHETSTACIFADMEVVHRDWGLPAA